MAKHKSFSHHININLNVRGLKPSATLLINEQSNELIRQGKKVYKFGLGQSPFPVPERVVEALRQHAHEKDYLPVKGLPALQQAVAEFNLRTQGISTLPEDIMIGPGSKELIFLLQLVYYGDLIIPTPSWVSYSPQAKIIGRNVHWAPTFKDNNWRLSPMMLEEICRTDPDRPRVVILNYPSNPTGYTYPLERLKLLAKVARKYKVILVSDEIYGLIHHQGQHISVARYYPEGTIISSGLSKWCGAGGWRLGTFSFPKELRWLKDAIAVVASETFTSTSAPIQHAAVTAFQGGDDIEEYLKASRKILHRIAVDSVGKLRDMKVDIQIPNGAFYLFPDFDFYREVFHRQKIFSSAELCRRMLEDTGVAMLPGSDFGRDPKEFTTRMAYVNFDGKAALEAVHENNHCIENGFVKNICPDIYQGFETMGNWLNDL